MLGHLDDVKSTRTKKERKKERKKEIDTTDFTKIKIFCGTEDTITNVNLELGMIVHTYNCNPSIQETEAGGLRGLSPAWGTQQHLVSTIK
jgi:hypothetical protein